MPLKGNVDGSTAIPRFLAWSAILLLGAAMLLAYFARGDGTLGWDIAISKWIQQVDADRGEPIYRIGHLLGKTKLAAGVIALGLIVTLLLRKWFVSIFLVLVIILRAAAIELKPIFDSARPSADQVRVIGHFDGNGFPSGHSLTVAIMATVVTLIAWHCWQYPILRWGISILSLVAIVLVGWSRIWAGAHWASDVLAGWAFGVALALIAWILATKLAWQIEMRLFATRTQQ